MSEILGKISSSNEFFEELFGAVSYILAGFLFTISICYAFLQLDTNRLIEFLSKIDQFKNQVGLFLIGTIIFYIIGNICALTFDFLIGALVLISKHLSKIQKVETLFRSLNNFFYITYPLHSAGDSLSKSYKEDAKKIITKYFGLNMDAREANRMCKEICIQNQLIKLYKRSHNIILLESIFMSMLIAAIKLITLNNYVLGIFLILLALFALKQIRKDSINLKVNYIDTAVTYIIGLDKKNK